MISALLLCADNKASRHHEARALPHLAQSLAAMVPAVVAGFVGQVVVVAVGGGAADDEALAHLCEEAGCAVVFAKTLNAGLAQAVALLRHEAVLVLKSGALLDAVAVETLERYCLTNAPKFSPIGRLCVQPQSWWQHIGIGQEVAGAVMGKAALQDWAGQKNLTLAKFLRTKPAKVLPAKVAMLRQL